MTAVRFRLKGEAVAVEAEGDRPLLAVLRNDLGLRAARFRCGTESCVACMVVVDGRPRFACTLPLAAVAGAEITSPEGLAAHPAGRALRDAFAAEGAGQCGYCLSGVLMSAVALLAADPRPTRAAVLAALDPHLCRCGAHPGILRAVERAAGTAP